MALNNTFVKNIKYSIGSAVGKYRDGGGMYLLVNASGKYWRMDYRFADKRKTLSLGVYPSISIAKARQRREKAREQLADGFDPGVSKRDEKMAKAITAANTFEVVAREFHKSKSDSWSSSYAEKWLRGQEKDLFPYIGRLPLAL